MWFLDFVNIALSAAATCPAPSPTPPAYFCQNCPSSAFSAVSAAFATLGYYAQAGWIEQIFTYGMSTWAILLYVVAAIGMLISTAMGQPVKSYLWLIIGPPLFYWLVEARSPVTGVAWRVGSSYSGVRDMREVWKLTETGLANDWYILRHGFLVTSEMPPVASGGGGSVGGSFGGFNWIFNFGGKSCYSGACVSDFFAFFDRLVSDTVQRLISFVGVSRVISTGAGPTETSIVRGISSGVQKWDITSSLRWSFIQSITDAHLRNSDVREAFSTFMSSECGDAFVRSIDKRAMVALKNRDPGMLLQTSFLKLKTATSTVPLGPSGSVLPPDLPYKLWDNLYPKRVPTPDAVKRLIREDPSNIVGAESGITELVKEVSKDNPKLTESLSCRTYFVLLMQAFRWEAAHQAYHILNSGPGDVSPDDYVAHMLYGWDIKRAQDFQQIDINDARKFIMSWVLANLFSNELVIAPGQVVEKRFTSGEQSVQNVKDFQRVNNQRAKYGELYTWALMIPYFQGQLLYFLAIAYPFACMLVVLPGMHKTVFTWMQHWVWVKMWDLGFAVVMVLERTIWSMVVNKNVTPEVNQLMTFMSLLNDTQVTPDPPCKGVFIPEVTVPLWLTSTNGDKDAYGLMLDKLLALTTNINLDLANSYYIYIMSALYFAVPVVTGTLVLGAKSGLASMLGSTLSQIAQPGGNAAGSAAVGEMQNRMQQAQAVARQQAFAKDMRASGFAAQALGAANSSTMAGISASARNQLASNYGARMQAGGDAIQSLTSSQQVAGTVASGIQSSVYRLGRYLQPTRAAAAADGVGATGADSPTGGVGRFFKQAYGIMPGRGAIGSMLQGGIELGGQFVNVGSAWARNEAQQAFLGDINEMRGQQVGLGVGAFSAQAEGQRLGLHGQRLQEAGMFSAQMAEWQAAKSYSDQNSGFLSAIGGMSGSLGPGQAPTGMGMAWGGGLGSGAQAAARAADSGGAIQGNSFFWSGNLANRGSAWVQQGFQATDIGTAWSQSIGGGKQFLAAVTQLYEKAPEGSIVKDALGPKEP